MSWVRYRDTSLIAVGKFVYISDNRFKVLHEVNSSDWFLVIKSVTYDDQGIYECQVNSDPYKTFKFHLSVVGKYLGNVFFLSLIRRPHINVRSTHRCIVSHGYTMRSYILIYHGRVSLLTVFLMGYCTISILYNK